jgi:hypothetical protein
MRNDDRLQLFEELYVRKMHSWACRAAQSGNVDIYGTIIGRLWRSTMDLLDEIQDPRIRKRLLLMSAYEFKRTSECAIDHGLKGEIFFYGDTLTFRKKSPPLEVNEHVEATLGAVLISWSANGHADWGLIKEYSAISRIGAKQSDQLLDKSLETLVQVAHNIQNTDVYRIKDRARFLYGELVDSIEALRYQGKNKASKSPSKVNAAHKSLGENPNERRKGRRLFA